MVDCLVQIIDISGVIRILRNAESKQVNSSKTCFLFIKMIDNIFRNMYFLIKTIFYASGTLHTKV